ncbi:MAG: cysteine desulfurase [Lachnospiraceae bacterium]|nr:cysteine desulfurase [Lachnospiraceae bacterium]
MKEIYLDNSATTKVFPEIAELMTKIYTEDYGNPSSMHNKGVAAEKYIKEARQQIAGTLKVKEGEIIFTSCGTESDNMALFGAAHALKRKGDHIITTKVEHPAVLRCMEALEKEGYRITYIGTDKYGVISLDELKEAICEDTILVSIMHVNNEIGSVMPIAEAGALIKSIDKNIIFHVDAVQSYGKFRIFPKKMNIDMLSVSGHKIHGPKGIGFLYIDEKVRIAPLILGGGQQNNMRSGTENVAGIAAIGLASKMMYQNLDEDVSRMYELKKHLIEGLTEVEGVSINGNEGAPHVISVSVKDVRAEVLLHALEDKGVYISAGSACSTHKKAVSETLKSIGLDKSLLGSTVRFSLSVLTTKEEIDEAIAAFKETVPILRRYVPK